ncbi:IclR family transcriptional regulator [Bradyrhizobium sp. CW1]|uniref:IclR family transcriptional regulator n=1 Tax=Bradyrhizobium sp. CW1 TaxID=2782686 RepID=UPI001FFE6B31|nr:IclR family transcriptional regulator [Bradyrhizobium sp. CW1]UPJ26389.1 IclR family transcriptional regulator [Bradyrhizobium sp. CW1]
MAIQIETGRAPATKRKAKQDLVKAPLPRIQSLGRGFSVLFLIAKSENGLMASDIIKETKLNRQTAYHILQSLSVLGVIVKNHNSQRYVLGLKVAGLIEAFKRHLAPPERLAPLVREIANRTGETAYAVGWAEGEIVVISAMRGRATVTAIDVPPGYFGNAHARASGKLLLALSSPDVRKAYFETRKLEALTPRTITNLVALEKHFAQIRKQGYALEKEEFVPGLSCIAVPIGDTETGFAIAVSAPSHRVEENLTLYLQVMCEVAMRSGE